MCQDRVAWGLPLLITYVNVDRMHPASPQPQGLSVAAPVRATSASPPPSVLGSPSPPVGPAKSSWTQGTRRPGVAYVEAAIQSEKKNMHFLSVSDDLESGKVDFKRALGK